MKKIVDILSNKKYFYGEKNYLNLEETLVMLNQIMYSLQHLFEADLLYFNLCANKNSISP